MYHLQIIVDSCTLFFLPLLCLVARVSILSGKLFSLNYFSVPVLVRGCSLGCFSHFRVAMDTSLQPMEFGTLLTFKVPIVHFRVPPGLCFKTRVGAHPLIWKSIFMLMQIKLIFTRKIVHLASFWKWGFLELGSSLFSSLSICDEFNCIFWALKTVTFEISTVWIFSLRINSYNAC